MTQIPPLQSLIETDPDGRQGGVKSAGFGAKIRNWFLTGIVVAGPVAVTAYIVWWFVDTIDAWVRGLLPQNVVPDFYLPFRVPGLGVVLAFLGLTLLGCAAHSIAAVGLFKIGEALLARMPVIRSIYKSVKQIFETLFSQSGQSFRKVGMIEFPGKASWSIVFISLPPSPLIGSHLASGEPYVSVFLPCAPNPTTGFYFYVPAREVIELAITPEAAAKLIMSCGVIQPEAAAALAAVALHPQRETA
ncbi:DUF502 domain-containing protein [Methylocella silvestris]|uniref:DUF502 domain-containing protein n=1 Tax=Methylocella silvestris TaxID=199596 RepID=A0A2J7TD67_METSI|nr:DUF502 domain-containing protein [Methylocella silvestris]PNG24699.1 hypothetical protein CR492_17405 [Methylocella silvestris]